MILLPLNLYLFDNDVEHFDSNNNKINLKVFIYFITFVLSCYAFYVSYTHNIKYPSIIFNNKTPNLFVGIIGFLLGWLYLVCFFLRNHFKYS